MAGRSRLRSQIVWSMSLVAVIVALIIFVGTTISFAILFSYRGPPPGPPDSFLPRLPDYLRAAVFLLLGLIVAAVFAVRLAQRILSPLTSLAESARRIAAGDLTARADPGDRSLGETAALVDDFNAMAARLQGMAEEMTAWNAAIAHELRTPLTILRGRLQGLTDRVFEPSDALFLNLLAQVEGLSRLVEDLRVVTLFDSGRLEIRTEPTDLAVEIQRALDAMKPGLVAAGFTVETAVQPLVLVCDGVRLRQALLALLENARRYAVPGPLKVAMREEAGGVVIAVEDRGPGLPPDFAARAFDTFARAEASRSRRSGGSGLGLSVVRAIAAAHNGRARYRAATGGGSVFEIVLPLARP